MMTYINIQRNNREKFPENKEYCMKNANLGDLNGFLGFLYIADTNCLNRPNLNGLRCRDVITVGTFQTTMSLQRFLFSSKMF